MADVQDVLDLLVYSWDINISSSRNARESAMTLINHKDDNLRLRKRDQYDAAIDMLIGVGQCDTNSFAEARMLFVRLVTNIVTQYHTGQVDVLNAYCAALGDEGLKCDGSKKHTVKSEDSNMAKKATTASKMDQARVIFVRHTKRKGDLERQNVLKEFQEKVGLTEAGAATYFNSIKNEHAEGRLDGKGNLV